MMYRFGINKIYQIVCIYTHSYMYMYIFLAVINCLGANKLLQIEANNVKSSIKYGNAQYFAVATQLLQSEKLICYRMHD